MADRAAAVAARQRSCGPGCVQLAWTNARDRHSALCPVVLQGRDNPRDLNRECRGGNGADGPDNDHLRGHLIPADTCLSLGGELFTFGIPQFRGIAWYRSPSWSIVADTVPTCPMPGGR
jgi:hypothetical protein